MTFPAQILTIGLVEAILVLQLVLAGKSGVDNLDLITWQWGFLEACVWMEVQGGRGGVCRKVKECRVMMGFSCLQV